MDDRELVLMNYSSEPFYVRVRTMPTTVLVMLFATAVAGSTTIESMGSVRVRNPWAPDAWRTDDDIRIQLRNRSGRRFTLGRGVEERTNAICLLFSDHPDDDPDGDPEEDRDD